MCEIRRLEAQGDFSSIPTTPMSHVVASVILTSNLAINPEP